MIMGYLGVVVLSLAWSLTLTKYAKFFIPMNCTATYILLIHAILLGDIPFILANIWIASILSYKWYTRNYEVD